MKKILKFTGILLLLIIVGFFYFAMYVKNINPDVAPAEKIIIEKSTARIEHGRYLANSVAVCMDCHRRRELCCYS